MLYIFASTRLFRICTIVYMNIPNTKMPNAYPNLQVDDRLDQATFPLLHLNLHPLPPHKGIHSLINPRPLSY